MYAIEWTGDYKFRQFASSKSEIGECFDFAISWLREKGYRKVSRQGKRLFVKSPNGGLVVIEPSPTFGTE